MTGTLLPWSREFVRYRRGFVDAFRDVLTAGGDATLSEAAFPAYAERNPLLAFLFWERIRRTMRYLADSRVGTALDFGCGGGVMLPFLAARATRVIAVDQDFGPLAATTSRGLIPAAVERLEPASLPALPPRSLDLIVALDVLEHVEDLDGTIADFCRLLSARGQLVVSVPTENVLYRIGRRIAGPVYSGDYHERGAAAVVRAVARHTVTTPIATLYPVVPLFTIFAARPLNR